MKTARRVVMLLALGGLATLTFLSVVGAFAGVERARLLFNSPPLVAFWISFTLLLAASLVFFKRLLRSPGLLCIHAGSILVLVGAMLGSEAGHRVASALLGTSRLTSGFMQIFEGETASTVSGEDGNVAGELPFAIRLEDFWIEHYDEESPWRLSVEAPPLPGRDEPRVAEIVWTEGRETPIPFTDATLLVRRSLRGYRPTYEEGDEPVVEVTTADGRTRSLPAKVGARIEIEVPPGVLEVEKVFGHLQVREGEVVDVPGSSANPAVKVRFEEPDGTASSRYAFGRETGMQDQAAKGLKVRLVTPRPTGVEPDPGSDLPAIEVEVTGPRGERLAGWIMVTEPDRPAGLSLGPVLGEESGEGGGPDGRTAPAIVLHQSRPMIRDFKSRLVVVEDGRDVASQVIEVNHPLHYGGYHFYQHSYDPGRGAFTVLSVRSDAGLDAVWLGFALTALGLFWIFWVAPVRRALGKGRENGSEADD